MGIFGLTLFLKKKFKLVPKTCNLDKFSGTRIGIDGNLLLFKYTTTSLTFRETYYKFVNHLEFIRKKGLIPIICFDSFNNSFVEKNDTQKKRIENKKKSIKRTKNIIKNLEEKLQESSPIEYSDTKQLIRKKKQSLRRPKTHDFIKIIKLLPKRNFDVILSKDDGDKLLANLYYSGFIDAIYSRDSDFLAFGIEKIIVKIEGNIAHYWNFQKILDKTNLTHEEFTTLCVLCGTDFNDNIAGFGAFKTYNLISEKKCTQEHINKCKNFDFSFEMFSFDNIISEIEYKNSLIKFDDIKKFNEKEP